jgi:hypothetical protein
VAASSYQPDIREIPAHCLVRGYWVCGGICLPARRALQDHLSQSEPFLRLRSARIAGTASELAFLALRRDCVSMIAPSEHAERLQRGGLGRQQEQRITCLLEAGVVTGTLELMANLRVSDHLMREPGFIVLRDCGLVWAARRAPAPFPSPAPILLVNTSHILGVTDHPSPR